MKEPVEPLAAIGWFHNKDHGGSQKVRLDSVGRLLARRAFLCCLFHGQGTAAAIIELDAAKTAMVQLAIQQALQKIQKAGLHGIDAVALPELRYARRPALRALDVKTQMVAPAAWNPVLFAAVLAFVDRHVADPFQEGSVNTEELPSTAGAFIHAPIPLIIAQLHRPYKWRHNKELPLFGEVRPEAPEPAGRRYSSTC